ncbi:MAG: HAMP domain-containing sensor histidine kinase, partial [Planctomycetota bacterium]
AFAAWLAARRSAETAGRQQEQVTAALAASRVALSMPVLDALHRLTGSHFIVWNEGARSHGISTFPAETLAELGDDAIAAGVAARAIDIGGQRHRIGIARSEGVRPEAVLVLSPQRALLSATLEGTWPVLVVAAATLAVLVPLGLRTTGRLARRIAAVERHVGRIAEGEFSQQLADPTPGPGAAGDEVSRLVAGVNRMSTMLGDLRTSLVAGERQRLLGQLAAGFAHELRNATTGARLAIDLHRRRCPQEPSVAAADESLTVAVRQLAILEEEVRGLLALGKPAEGMRGTLSVDQLLGDVRDLTAPRCEHAGVQMGCDIPTGLTIVGRHDSLRAALVNLALNGIDAAGRAGMVRLRGTATGNRVELAVEDTGPGPPESIRAGLGEPFVTGKPEGIGLGLTVARAVAEEHGGTLEWSRTHGRTRFAISLPAQRLDELSAAATHGRES